MDISITLAAIGIIPPIITAYLSYVISSKKIKHDYDKKMVGDFNKLSEKLRSELKTELDECRKDREDLRSELNEYKKELDEYKQENEKLKKELNELETKLDSANEVISTLVTNKKKLAKAGKN